MRNLLFFFCFFFLNRILFSLFFLSVGLAQSQPGHSWSSSVSYRCTGVLQLTPCTALRTERCRNSLTTSTYDLGHGVKHGASLATHTTARVCLFSIISRLSIADVRGKARGVKVASNDHAKTAP